MNSQSIPSQQEPQAAPVVSALRTCTLIFAAIAILVGGLGLLDWVFDLLFLKNFRSRLVMMEAEGALAFVLSGITLWMRRTEPLSPRTRRLAHVFTFAILLIGLFALLQYAVPRYFGLVPVASSTPTQSTLSHYPSLMTPATALLFVALSLALLTLDVEDRRGQRPAQVLFLLVGLFALAALVGYLFAILSAKQGTPYSSIMWPSALTFVLLSLGGLCARPDRGFVRIITEDAVGGMVARRLLPAALIGPPLLCILCYVGYHFELYDAGFGLAVLTTLNSAVLTILIWRTSGALNRTEGRRRRIERERNELNSALHGRVTELETLLDVLPIAVGIAEDPKCEKIRTNPAFAKLLSLPPGANASKSAPENQAPTSFKVCRNGRELSSNELPMQVAAATGMPVYDFDEEVVWSDGTLLRLLVYAAPLRDEYGVVRGSVGVFVDITTHRRLEEQLFQARKLESIGRLAGGVAHDFNNLLTVILGYSELLEAELPADSDPLVCVRTIQKAANRAAGLTSQLLAFARRQVIEPRVVNLNDLILDLDSILQRLIGEHIHLVVQPATDLHSVSIDPVQFEQILLNLIINARDAIDLDGGSILVETMNVNLDDAAVRLQENLEEIAPGEYVKLAVIDTGIGMDETMRMQIFEPFFTTKEKGQGTGLGLATVYGIVKQAGGHILLASEMGKGTTFSVYFPRAAEQPTVAVVSVSPVEASRGMETLLIVEDEDAVRAMTTAALRGLGYHVLEAGDGAEALQINDEYAEHIDLLITDVVMPHMSGKDVADRLVASRPTLKVLFVSGYTDNTIEHHGVLEPGIALLPKPFTPSALSTKVRDILNAVQAQ